MVYSIMAPRTLSESLDEDLDQDQARRDQRARPKGAEALGPCSLFIRRPEDEICRGGGVSRLLPTTHTPVTPTLHCAGGRQRVET